MKRKKNKKPNKIINQYNSIDLHPRYNNYTCTGREQERDSRFYYYRTIYYDSQTGRFTSVDPILREIKNKTKTYFLSLSSSVCSCCGSVSSYPSEVPLGEEVIPQMKVPEPASFLSPYVYVENNPVNEIDPEGKMTKEECLELLYEKVKFLYRAAKVIEQTIAGNCEMVRILTIPRAYCKEECGKACRAKYLEVFEKSIEEFKKKGEKTCRESCVLPSLPTIPVVPPSTRGARPGDAGYWTHRGPWHSRCTLASPDGSNCPY